MPKIALALNIFAFFLFLANGFILYQRGSAHYKMAFSLAALFLILSIFYGRKFRKGNKS